MPIFHEVMIVCLYFTRLWTYAYISRGCDSMPIFHEVMIVCLYFTRL